MYFKSSNEVISLVRKFENRTLRKEEWTHAEHLVVGLYYLTNLPFSVAKNVMRDGIVWLNDAHGTPNTDDSGYHETLTVFWLKRIWNFIDSRPDSMDLAVLANELLEVYQDPHCPLGYYSRGLLFSAAARRDYYPPDLHLRPAFVFPIALAILKPLL